MAKKPKKGKKGAEETPVEDSLTVEGMGEEAQAPTEAQGQAGPMLSVLAQYTSGPASNQHQYRDRSPDDGRRYGRGHADVARGCAPPE